jgi:uncharacterized protein YbbC (DUF1343 family)
MFRILFLILLFIFSSHAYSAQIEPGAERLNAYLSKLKDKRVAVFANHSSLVGLTPLVDELLKHHIQVVKIFAPEHGFSTNIDGRIHDDVYKKNKNIPIVSLYGKKLTPTALDLQDVDIIVFDIQDVGVRFYTYISSLQKLMEAAVNYNKPLIILDRPNPNGFYVDGPVLLRKYKSFTGMQPIPVVYGMTIGEYAKMLVGEEWLNVTPKSKSHQLKLTVIRCAHYTHKSLYEPPVKPSPNLPNIQSIYWYPTIGLFEATSFSVGRGTSKPFQIFGHPILLKKFTFIPTARPGAESPPYKNQICHGWNLFANKNKVLKEINGKIQIKYLIEAYRLYPYKENFFKGFSYAAGTNILEEQIKAGFSEQQIRKSWQPELLAFKKIRKKYLLYPDFENSVKS